jgi:glycosyltransferase involved in cell wall biosynthesis
LNDQVTARESIELEAGADESLRLAGRGGRRPFVMIDGFNLALEKGTGVATYARNLSFALRDLGADVGVLYGGAISPRYPALLQEVLFYDPPELTRRWQELLRGARAVLSSNRSRAFQVPLSGAVVADGFRSRLPYYDSIWNSRNLFYKAAVQFDTLGAVNRITMPRKPDLCHWTYPLPVRVPGVPNIYTLHDLVPLRLPYTTLDRKAHYLRLVQWICHTADHIVTVSENSKRDIVELLRMDPERVTNTYEAVTIPAEYRDKPEDVVRREVQGTVGLPFGQYFLFFGSIEPKKNIGRMIEGYLASSVSTPLVIVGARSWKADRELGLLDMTKLAVGPGVGARPKRRIVRLEFVPYGLLVSLIRGAKAVLFPSLYEGFGLPILESMSLGTPVLTSNTSSVPEVAGDAALPVNPYDPRQIADGIRALDSNDALCAELSERGRRQALRFSEAAYRERLSTVYEKVGVVVHSA